jgi:transposase
MVRFSRADCSACPARAQCTKAKVEPRILFLQSREEHDALQSARDNQQTDAFETEYALRAGVES